MKMEVGDLTIIQGKEMWAENGTTCAPHPQHHWFGDKRPRAHIYDGQSVLSSQPSNGNNRSRRLSLIPIRAFYYPVDGPVKYVFNTIECALRINNHLIFDVPSLIDEMRNVIANIKTVVPYFIYRGFHLE
jgi:hypothetical protein